MFCPQNKIRKNFICNCRYEGDVFGGDQEDYLGEWPSDNVEESKAQLQKKLSYHTRQVVRLRRNNASPEQIGKEVKSLQEVELVIKNQMLKDVRKKFRSRYKLYSILPYLTKMCLRYYLRREQSFDKGFNIF